MRHRSNTRTSRITPRQAPAEVEVPGEAAATSTTENKKSPFGCQIRTVTQSFHFFSGTMLAFFFSFLISSVHSIHFRHIHASPVMLRLTRTCPRDLLSTKSTAFTSSSCHSSFRAGSALRTTAHTHRFSTTQLLKSSEASSKSAAQQQPVPALILKPFINFKVLANPETASAMTLNIQHRNMPNSISVAAINELHKTVADMSQKLDKARSERNRVAAEMKDLFSGESSGGKGKRKKQGDQNQQQSSMSPQDREQKRKELVERGRVLKEDIHAQETEFLALESKLYEQAVMIPNSTHPTTPIGPESAAQLIRIQGVPRLNSGIKAFAHPGSEESSTGGEQARALLGNGSSYPLLDHVTLSKTLDLIDFEAATAVTGSRWYYLKNEAALLELALIQFATQRAVRKGFTPVITPDVVRPEVVQACGFQPRDEASQTYWVSTAAPGSTSKEAAHHHQHSALCLVATAEIALAGMNMNRVLEESQLPMKLAGFGRAFRAEAGSRGAEVKGLYRVHQFSKVELFVVSKADQVESDKALEEIRQFQEDIFEELGLCYR